MSSVYDKAHELAGLIEQEENYKTVKELTELVMNNPEQMQLIEDFRRKQYGLQQQQMLGQEIDEKELEDVNKLYEHLSNHAEIKNLIDAEERLSILFSDVNRILTGPLEKIYKK